MQEKEWSAKGRIGGGVCMPSLISKTIFEIDREIFKFGKTSLKLTVKHQVPCCLDSYSGSGANPGKPISMFLLDVAHHEMYVLNMWSL
jgi:hypothetical protein